MPGIALGIGETNPKRAAIQYSCQRIDGVPFIIPSGASVITAPIGSVVSLQECTGIGQKIVLGLNAYTDLSSNTYSIIGIGFLEAATQADGNINQTLGEYSSGDMATMIMDINAVAMCPMVAGALPVLGSLAYVDVDGVLTNVSYENVVFPGVVFFSTPGMQTGNQLKSGYCFARIAPVELSIATVTYVEEA